MTNKEKREALEARLLADPTQLTIEDFLQVNNKSKLDRDFRNLFARWISIMYEIDKDPITGVNLNTDNIVLDHCHHGDHIDPTHWDRVRGPLSHASNTFEGNVLNRLKDNKKYKLVDYPSILRETAKGLHDDLMVKIQKASILSWKNKPPTTTRIKKLIRSIAKYWEKDHTTTPYGTLLY